MLVTGAVFINWNFYLHAFHRSTTAEKAIALTFDDGPAAETAAILDILQEHNVPAAFFSIGRQAAAHPELVQRWYREGHLVGNHSYDHGFHFDWKTATAMQQEMEQTNALIHSLIGKKPKLFRPPYGVTNPNLARAVRCTEMFAIGWNIRSFDTTAKDRTALLNRILDRLKGGDIVLMHDSMPITREILTDLIICARRKGFTFVRVDKMLGLDAYA